MLKVPHAAKKILRTINCAESSGAREKSGYVREYFHQN